MAWQNNNTVSFMSTAHNIAEAEASCLKSIEHYTKISKI